MKIGIFGGSFDPITNAHLILAETAREKFKLDSIDFIPTYQNPFKYKYKANDNDRLLMILSAIKDNLHFQCSTFDIKNKVVNSIDTINHYKSLYTSDVKLYFLMGSDSYLLFHKWKDYHKILNNVTLLVATRVHVNGIEGISKDKKIKFFDLPFNGISSTDVRKRIKKGKSIRYLVPESVEKYINEEGIY